MLILVFLFIHVFLIVDRGISYNDSLCRDPSLGGTLSVDPTERKYIIIGHDYVKFEGLGNIMIFYPAIYHFAAITGKQLLIPDFAIIGEFCSIIYCGFPTVEEMSNAYPNFITYPLIKSSTTHQLRSINFNEYIEGTRVWDSPLLRAVGNTAKSQWWATYKDCIHCISRITGCDLGDISCADRHAYQALIKGPFKNQTVAEIEKQKLLGLPNTMKHALFTLPHAYAPRIDIAVHIRAQFNHFEKKHWDGYLNSNYKVEIFEWLNSTEANTVFESIESKILEIAKLSRSTQTIDKRNQQNPIYVYIASDCQEVKEAFARRLDRYHEDLNYPLQPVYINATHIVHTKHYTFLKSSTNGEGMVDLALDWYMLSLSNYILGWRNGYSSVSFSTFLQSALRVSGTKHRTSIELPLGKGGVGSKGYVLVKHPKRGHLMWADVWAYGFLDDYKISKAE